MTASQYAKFSRKLNAKVVDRSNRLCGSKVFNNDAEFCYGTSAENGLVCKLDDGDPILRQVPDEVGRFQWRQVGIQSHGHENCDAEYTVATRLSTYAGWIANRIRELS